MIDIKKILSLPPAERDDEIRKLIVPKPWKHDYHCQIPMMAKGKNGWCYKCEKDIPKWFQLRRKLSMWLLALAKKVYPENPEVWAFMSKIMADTMITGQAITRIDPMKFLKETNAETPEAKNDKEKECPK